MCAWAGSYSGGGVMAGVYRQGVTGSDFAPYGGPAIWVDSPRDATFRRPASGQRPNAKPLRTRVSSPLVLVVEDEVEMRALLRRLLTRAGYRVVEASDGSAALACLRATAPDLVLLDIMLPDIDGLEVARWIRAEPTIARLPIIMVTGLLPAVEAVQAFTAGADDYVRKPFHRD